MSAEYWLHNICAYPDRQLFDWGMMRVQYPFSMYGIGDSFAIDVGERHRRKRYTEVLFYHDRLAVLFIYIYSPAKLFILSCIKKNLSSHIPSKNFIRFVLKKKYPSLENL